MSISPIRSQRGLAAAAVVILIILAVLAIILARGTFRSDADLSRRGVTDASLARISKALLEYAALNRRLPCPARGDLDTGDANPDTATTTCTTMDGVVPWKTLAMRREDAVDGWGRKISYRVFDGATGFTQADGVSMTNCNTSLGAPITGLATGSLCGSGSPPPNTPTQFLSARGNMLAVQDMGTARNGNAFVLISHGESGLGAYGAEGGARSTMPNASGDEFTNTQAGGTYRIVAHSDPSVASTSASYFDDVVTYMTASDLATNAKLAARSWSNFPLTATFSESAVNTALGFSLGSAENTGRTSLSMGGFLITATADGATRNVGFEQSGLGGLGVIGGSSTSGDLNSSFGETLTFQLGTGSEFGKMDVALNAFEITDNSPLRKEVAEISFRKAGTLLQRTTLNAWDETGTTTSCLLRLPTGSVFDRMDLTALDQTNSGGSSRFQIAAIKACTDATAPCTSAASAVACPIRPPSAKCSDPLSVGKTTATLLGTVEDNGVAKGTGTGYRTPAGAGYGIGTNSISLISGSGTIIAGNCVSIQDDTRTYVVKTGITAPGTLVLADPGLLQSISFVTIGKTVTLTPCQTSVSFDFGTTLAYGSSATATPATISAGTGSTCVTSDVTGLSCSNTYYYRTKATGLAGTTVGNDCQFSTAACSSVLPSAQTLNATSIGTTTATLNGVVNDNGSLTTVTFVYGLTPCYGSSVVAVPATVGAGTGSTAVRASLTELTCNTYYHYRVMAVSSGGTATGNDTLLLTSACL